MTRLVPVLRVLAVLLAILAALFFLLFGVLDWLFQLGLLLPFGWVSFLTRVAPQVRPNPTEWATAGAGLVVLVVGVHRFGRWLYPALVPGGVWSWRWTGRVVGLVVLLFVCGTAAIGVTHQVGWLLTSPEPVIRVSGGIREASARAQSANNLKQMGLGVHAVHDASGLLLAPTFTTDGRPFRSWHFHLLPYVEQEPLYARFDKSAAWNHPANRPAAETRVKVFLHPEGPDSQGGYAVTHFAPNARLFDRPRRFTPADFPLGTANTVLAGEAVRDPTPWADPLTMRDPFVGPNRRGGFSGPRPDRVQVLMADGSVRSVQPNGWDKLLRGEADE